MGPNTGSLIKYKLLSFASLFSQIIFSSFLSFFLPRKEANHLDIAFGISSYSKMNYFIHVR